MASPDDVSLSDPQTDAWVDSLSPLMVTTKGATVPVPAAALASASLTVGAHVTVTLRTPARPLIQGVVA